MEEKRVSIALDDKRLKDVAESITNKTCNKILQYLVDKTATVSEISEKLKLPINTVDYNIKKLLRADLIEKDSHWWSVKGKKMPTYKISNKEIIIKPKKLVNYKKYLVALFSTGVIGLFLNKISLTGKVNTLSQIGGIESTQLFAEAPKAMVETTMDGARDLATSAVSSSFNLGIGHWFIIGAWLIILAFFIYSIISERRKDLRHDNSHVRIERRKKHEKR